MKNLIRIILLLLLLPTPLYAEFYWMAETGTQTSLSACSGSTPLSGASACDYDAVDYDGSSAVAGDTVYFRAGSGYLVSDGAAMGGIVINPVNSGTQANPITFSAYNGETVIFTADDNRDRAVLLDNDDWIKIFGIEFRKMYKHLWIWESSDYNEVAYCTFDEPYSYIQSDMDWRGSTLYRDSTYNWIHHNTFDNYGYQEAGVDHAVVFELGNEGSQTDTTSFNVIENNIFKTGGHHTIGIIAKFNALRRNYMEHSGWFDVGGTLYGNRVIYARGQPTANHSNLIERNRIAYGEQTLDTDCGGSGGTYSEEKLIIRFNMIYQNPMNAMYIDYHHDPTTCWDMAIYNNTIWHVGYSTNETEKGCWSSQWTHGILIDEYNGCVRTGIKNNIFYDNDNEQNASWDIIEAYQAGDGGLTELQEIAGNWHGNVDGDPLFVDITGTPDPDNSSQWDFSLQSGSGAIDNGTWLTQANGSGSNSTSLIVDNEHYFQPGWGNGAGGGAVVEADTICISSSATDVTGCTEVQIISIDYDTETITLASAKTWSNNDYIFLVKDSEGTDVLSGVLPDQGAHEYNTSQSSSSGISGSGVGGNF